MSSDKPLKRHTALRGFSTDHHHGLVLCRTVRNAIEKGIEPERVSRYVRWFFDYNLKPHFSLEEQIMFPVLGTDHPNVQIALKQHAQIIALVQSQPSESVLEEFAEVLENHIRFEERVLFGQIQSAATETELRQIQEFHQQDIITDYQDPFWK